MKDRPQATDPLRITDTTFRDAHQSIAATRMRTQDMAPIAPEMDKAGFSSVEVWGGATFDVCTRFLLEDPWERVRTLKRLMPRTPLQMLLRGQNLVGYRNYPDDVVEAFVRYAGEAGMDIFRIFDALNDERNLKTALEAVKACGKHAQPCICYSVTEEGRLGGPVYNLDYFLQKALTLQKMGADSICIKDMAGLLAPYDAYKLVTALKGILKVPLHLHTHYTGGMASAAVIKAAEAGVEVADACLAPLALRSSQPAVEPIVVALKGSPRDTGLDLGQLIRLGDYFETLAPYLRQHITEVRLSVIDARVLTHQIPGGMVSNLLAQLKEADSLDRLPEVLEELPRTRRELGYPPLVTPTSQIVGAQAVNNVLFGRWKVVSSQVKDYVYGLYGRPPVPVEPAVVKLALKDYERGQQPVTGRAADYLEPELLKALEATKGLARDRGDVLIYALYPVTGMKFLRVKYGLEKPPEEPRPKVEALPAKPPSAQGPAVALSPRARTFNVLVAGRCFQVTVDPVSPQAQAAIGLRIPGGMRPAASGASVAAAPPTAQAAPVQAAAGRAGVSLAQGEAAVVAPMPGIVVRYAVAEGQQVKEGETVTVLEAMKMENALPSPIGGVVKQVCFQPGAKVGKGEVLAIVGA